MQPNLLNIDSIDGGVYPFVVDPHRCGSAPFSPQILVDGTQNSCGSYDMHYDVNGCNEYRPTYPDDDYITAQFRRHGNCVMFKDCNPVRKKYKSCMASSNRIDDLTQQAMIEQFGSKFPYLTYVLYVFVIYVLIKLVFCKF